MKSESPRSKVLPGDNGIMMLRCQELSMFAFCVPVPSVLIIREGLLVECIPGINLVAYYVIN